MSDEPRQQEIIRNPDGTFPPGVSGNPGGRKKKIMTSFIQSEFAKMSDDEKRIWLREVSKELQLQMVEGRPKQSIDGGEDKDGNPMPFTIVNTAHVPQGKVPTTALPAGTDTGV